MAGREVVRVVHMHKYNSEDFAVLQLCPPIPALETKSFQ